MKSLFWLLPFAVGICSVMQGVLNRRMAGDWGIGWAILLNSLVVIVLAVGLVAFNIYPGRMSFGEMVSSLKWWHFLPGFFGMAIIVFIPLSISKLGALNSFLILISSQILVSGLWDKLVEGMTLSWTRMLGASLALLGAWLATK